MRKSIVQSLLAGVIIAVVYYTVQVAWGMYLTKEYVPDLVNAYESVDYLQRQTAIGTISSPVWSVLEAAGLILLGAAVFYIGKTLWRKR
jgi:menaquinol-cytochrome c reductase cytochrome b subunit